MSTEDLRLAGLLKRAQALLVASAGPALAVHGVDGRELALLTLLDRYGPASQQDLGRRLGVDRTTMVALVDTLAHRDLVRREPHPADRRKNSVGLTGRGRAVCAAAGPAVDAVEARFLEPLPEPDRERLRDLLRTVIRRAEGAADRT
jgi:DNA-binding MarR family transcriptional regulator